MLTTVKNWCGDRFKERTSWDGGMLVAGCLCVILLGGIAKWAAWAGLVWGIYTIVKSQ
jgi:hypothetical protein